MEHILNENFMILMLLTLAALYTVMARSLLRSALGLAVTSAVLSILMFRLNCPWAAVFELSVCAGLIPVIFITTISLTRPRTMTEVHQHMMDRLSRFWYLPLLIVIAGLGLSLIRIKIDIQMPAPEAFADVRVLMWTARRLDLIGQATALLAGGLGIALLFRERRKK
jgi:NADH-quinone oxidoreductase subunit J